MRKSWFCGKSEMQDLFQACAVCTFALAERERDVRKIIGLIPILLTSVSKILITNKEIC